MKSTIHPSPIHIKNKQKPSQRRGKGLREKAYDEKGFPIIECDKNYFRPLDVNTLLGDARKARRQLKWKPSYNINSLIDEMIMSEYQKLYENK